jgi:hypothetical protein
MIPTTSCAEENLLGYESDPYVGENILIHEFGHAIHQIGLASLDKTFNARLKKTYARATGELHLWSKTYAASNPDEYWAEGVQSYFDANLHPTRPTVSTTLCARGKRCKSTTRVCSS